MRNRSSLSTPRPTFRALRYLSVLLFTFCLCDLAHPAFAQQTSASAAQFPNAPNAQAPVASLPGALTGSVSDQDGDSIPGAKITLSCGSQGSQGSPGSADERQAVAGEGGSFSFVNVTPGPFELTVTAPGFTTQRAAGLLQAGQQGEMPQIFMHAAVTIDVEVTASKRDIAQDQIAVQEKQRVLGAIPNFYVSYVSNPAPLVAKQKFELAWKMSVDPMNFILTGVVAGVEQSQNTFGEFGGGAQGYAKRYTAAYADGFISTMISNAILPTVFKQDPRYFYRGTKSIPSRALYAIASAVICKGDNGHWQPNYSNILGNVAASGISNLYYPRADRHVIQLTFEEALVGLAAGAGGNLFQEFLIRRITPRVHHPIHLREYD